MLRFTSRPIRNMNQISPKSARALKMGMDVGGKILVVKFGILPKTVGPRMMPEMICAMTLGCLMYANTRDRSTERPTTTMIWIRSCAMSSDAGWKNTSVAILQSCQAWWREKKNQKTKPTTVSTALSVTLCRVKQMFRSA